MKPKLIDRSKNNGQSFTISYLDDSYFFKVWHYHPELELILILESTGTQFVGDSIEKFQVGDVLLIGKNLPHLMFNDSEYFSLKSELKARAIVINFLRYFVGDTFLSMPEIKHIDRLLESSKRGIKFMGNTKVRAMKAMLGLRELDLHERLLELIKLLDILARSDEYRLLSSESFSNSLENIEKNRMAKVYDHVMNHFKENISLKEVAGIVHMNPTAFSRYFKKTHKKNFTQYVNEVRIRYACKLLVEKKMNISEICYECGFNNISNFNRQFRLIKEVSPKVYARGYSV